MCAKQTVIIPKGLIQPGVDAVIEIPTNLQGPGTVVARPKGGVSETNRSMVGPPTSPQNRNKRTPPPFVRKEYYDFDPSFTSSPQGYDDEESMLFRDFRPGTVSSMERPDTPMSRYLSPSRRQGPPSFNLNSTSSSGGRSGASEVLDSVASVEASELQLIVSDLSNFQNSRRKLILDTAGLKSAADVSTYISDSIYV